MGNEKQDIGNSILKVIKGDIIDNPKFQRSVDDLTPEAIKDFYIQLRHEITTVYNVFGPYKEE